VLHNIFVATGSVTVIVASVRAIPVLPYVLIINSKYATDLPNPLMSVMVVITDAPAPWKKELTLQYAPKRSMKQSEPKPARVYSLPKMKL
jgi:hypothetical protein